MRDSLEKKVLDIPSKNTWFAKVWRNFTAAILPVKEGREGECNNCGECCKLPAKCLLLGFREDGRSYCMIYDHRLSVCEKYPRAEYEHLTRETCGYYFNGK